MGPVVEGVREESDAGADEPTERVVSAMEYRQTFFQERDDFCPGDEG